MQHLNIAIIQSDLVWHNAAQNRNHFSKKIEAITGKVDLIVLPEMFTTGFSMSPAEIAETMQGNTVQWMQQIAKIKDAAVMGSLVIEENNAYFNRLLFVHPSGKIDFYNKRHLFTLAGEDKVYTPGNFKMNFDYRGFKICGLICYDLRFPVWARNVEGYDVLIYVANWPKTRISAWDTLLKARAIENMCYTIGVNRVGTDANNLEYNGHSAAYNYLGENCIEVIENEESTAVFSISKELLTATREKLNFLNDKDNFTIQL